MSSALAVSTETNSAIAKLNTAHDGMMDYILQNPGASLREIAGHFGYTIPWVCRVVNSDIFQARLAERRKDIEGLIASDIPAQLKATAGLAIEKIQEVLAKTEDPDTIIDAFDKVMHRAGYAPKATVPALGAGGVVNQQNNFFVVSKEDLQEMRGNVHSLPGPAPQVATPIEGTATREPESIPSPTT
jgi:DNA-binding MarR family transcriptional regulator